MFIWTNISNVHKKNKVLAFMNFFVASLPLYINHYIQAREGDVFYTN